MFKQYVVRIRRSGMAARFSFPRARVQVAVDIALFKVLSVSGCLRIVLSIRERPVEKDAKGRVMIPMQRNDVVVANESAMAQLRGKVFLAMGGDDSASRLADREGKVRVKCEFDRTPMSSLSIFPTISAC